MGPGTIKAKCGSCGKAQDFDIPKGVCVKFVLCKACKARIELPEPVCG